jgi:hypothetical protein
MVEWAVGVFCVTSENNNHSFANVDDNVKGISIENSSIFQHVELLFTDASMGDFMLGKAVTLSSYQLGSNVIVRNFV